MAEKGCDNCYYSFFDEKTYPCSLCIRGIKRTDQWQPSKKTKAEQTEPQTEKCPFDDPIPCEWVNCPNSSNCPYKTKDKPQTKE